MYNSIIKIRTVMLYLGENQNDNPEEMFQLNKPVIEKYLINIIERGKCNFLFSDFGSREIFVIKILIELKKIFPNIKLIFVYSKKDVNAGQDMLKAVNDSRMHKSVCEIYESIDLCVESYGENFKSALALMLRYSTEFICYSKYFNKTGFDIIKKARTLGLKVTNLYDFMKNNTYLNIKKSLVDTSID